MDAVNFPLWTPVRPLCSFADCISNESYVPPRETSSQPRRRSTKQPTKSVPLTRGVVIVDTDASGSSAALPGPPAFSVS